MIKSWDDIKDLSIDRQFVYYLLSCYLYYEEDKNVLLDSEFDTLCKNLLHNYDNITHRHKYLVDKEDLKASTGYQIQYPRIVRDSARLWYKDFKNNIRSKSMSLIVNRYLEIKDKKDGFLTVDMNLPYSRSLVGVAEGIDLVNRHMKENNEILLYTDFDCDGVTSMRVLTKSMDLLGYKDKCIPLVNKREFGNGINDQTVTYIKANPNIKLMITADHGSSNEYHISEIRKLGVDVIVTDHHQLRSDGAPKSANVFINPQQEEDNLFKGLSGCAVVYMFMYDLLNHNNIDFNKNEMLDIVAISIIGDMMDLSDPVNRALTLNGMKYLQTSKLGRAFKRLLGVEHISSKDVSFKIVPMINSCSRVSESIIGYVSIIESDDETMDDNLEYLNSINERRKTLQKTLVNTANKQLKPRRKTNVLVIPSSGTGINGIVASQLSNSTKRPTIIFIHGEETSTGSCRGFIPALDVKECFDTIHRDYPDIFVVENGEAKYGGHAGAAGCAVYTDKLDKFNELFEEYVSNLNYNVKDMIRQQKSNAIDISNIKNLDRELREIKRLEPFGNGWENPLLLVRPETIKNVRKIPLPGGDTILVKFVVRLDDVDYNFTHFHNANLDLELKGSDILCTANIGRNISFDVKDLI